jgi:type II secretory pathway predicted ATPase ExeA
VYLSFFGLAENPFSLAPDPRYLFMGASHRDALAQLEARRGIAVLTGEAGTGKTLLLLALRDRLDADTAVAYAFNTTLPFEGIVEFLLEDLGIAKPEESPARRLTALNSFLSERERAGQSTTLIVDEAQSLDALTLAQLGMLANLESATTSKRLQILLVGPLELEARLDHPDLQHPHDSIGVRCRIRRSTPARSRSTSAIACRSPARPTRACSASGRSEGSRSIPAGFLESSTFCPIIASSSRTPITSGVSTGTSPTGRSRISRTGRVRRARSSRSTARARLVACGAL